MSDDKGRPIKNQEKFDKWKESWTKAQGTGKKTFRHNGKLYYTNSGRKIRRKRRAQQGGTKYITVNNPARRGRGDYMSTLGQLASDVASTGIQVGSAYVGKQVGGFIDSSIRDGLSSLSGGQPNWSGSSDSMESLYNPSDVENDRFLGPSIGTGQDDGGYHVESNSLLAPGTEPQRLITFRKGAGTLFRHREYVCDIISGTTSGNTVFTLQSFMIQPGLPATFPWLSQAAANYQEYEILGMIFEFKSLTAGEVIGTSASGALGDVIMATNYNSAAGNFTNKQQMLESEYSSNAPSNVSFFHPIECEPNLNVSEHYYIRTSAIAATQDPRLYDHANFQIATSGCQKDGVVLGELHVTYEILLYKPLLGGLYSGLDLPTDKWQLTGPVIGTLFGTSQSKVTGSLINGTVAANTFTFPANVTQGTFLVNYYVVGGTGANVASPTLTPPNGVTLLQVFSSASGPDLSTTISSPTGVASMVTSQTTWIISLNPTSSSSALTVPVILTLSAGTLPTNSPMGDWIVTQINTAIAT